MSELSPKVLEVQLKERYGFMYEAYVFSDQHKVYLFLERDDQGIPALVFEGSTFKFGAPNDEALGGHPLARLGLGYYGLFEVLHSPWINELCAANRVHPRHSDATFGRLKHFIATFKDVTFEVVCRGFQEARYSPDEITAVFSGVTAQ